MEQIISPSERCAYTCTSCPVNCTIVGESEQSAHAVSVWTACVSRCSACCGHVLCCLQQSLLAAQQLQQITQRRNLRTTMHLHASDITYACTLKP
jgi:hypothetical protein